jgi:catechol 2,3-dioxygenase-like lactoylglutathione lyase family enzyme
MPRLDHAAFRVADLDRSVAFYERVLPARLISRAQRADRWRTEIATLRPVGDDGFTLVLLMPRRVRWLLRAFHALVPRQTRSHEHLGFAVASREELDERVRAAAAAGARVENRLTRLEDRDAWLFEVLDPDGNAVEWICGNVHG